MEMSFDKKVAKAFDLNKTGWERHANPWSVWTRFTVLPVLVLAIWSRVWLHEWSFVLIAAAILWMWLNPRLFSKPRSTNNRASIGRDGRTSLVKPERNCDTKIPSPNSAFDKSRFYLSDC